MLSTKVWWKIANAYIKGYVHYSCLSIYLEDASLVEFMYLVFTRIPCKSCRGRLRSLLLCLCGVFRALINFLVCWFYQTICLSIYKCFEVTSISAISLLQREFVIYLIACLIIINKTINLPSSQVDWLVLMFVPACCSRPACTAEGGGVPLAIYQGIGNTARVQILAAAVVP